MKISDLNLTGNQAVDSGKISNLQELKRQGESRPYEVRSGSVGADRVELSDLTGGLAHALRSRASDRVARMEQLSRAAAVGGQRSDPQAISRAMIAEMRSAGHNGTSGA
jgi:hypothetical protein